MSASEPTLKTLGRYEIQEEIGRGMMGIVYRALDPALGRSVALKTVSLAFSVPPEERERFEKRFQTEARVAAGLSHPGIVVVHDVGRDPETGLLYIALEFLQGRTLSELTADGAAMEWREALRLTARLAEALHHAHAQGIVHRDIKPANIMVLSSGEPKIMDFGIAKVPAAQLTTAGEFFGTPSYMSPEQIAGTPLDGRSDLFSLGCVLYLLLAGRRAFDGESIPTIFNRIVSRDPPPPSRFAPSFPPEVDYLVARALAKNVELRYADGRTFAEDLEDVREGRPPGHRAGWTAPPPADGTLVSSGEPETADLARQGLSGRAPAVPAPVSEASLLIRISDRLGRRGFLILGGLVVAGLLMAIFLPRGERTGEAPWPTLVEPGHLEVELEHSLKSGTLRLWIDDDLVLEELLESRVTKKVLSLRFRKGSVEKALEVAPGEHVVRVAVEGDGFSSSKRIRGRFESGVTRRLEARVGGLFKKDLSLEWGS